MEETTIPPDQQQDQKDRIGGAGSGPLPLDQQQTGTVVAEREHAPPDGGGDDGKAEIAGQ